MANYAPKLSVALYEAEVSRDLKKANDILSRIAPLFDFYKRVGESTSPHRYVSVCKEAMNLVGLRGGIPRLPLTPLTSEESKELEKVLRGMGVL